MKIASIFPTTLIDYPGHVAALIFTAGCNYRCPFCHNSELVLPEKIRALSLIPEADVFSVLKERQKFLDGVVITGGEPAIQPDLARFIERAKKLSYLVKLDTNGSRPEVLEQLLEAQLLDYVAMDLRGSAARYDELAGVRVDLDAIERSIRLIIDQAPDYEFRTTVAPTMTAEDITDAISLITGAKRYVLQRFVTPTEKEIVDPSWKGKVALSEGELYTLWEAIKGNFSQGGVR